MENFTMYNPTKLFFGKDVVNNLGKTVSPHGNKVLFVYGGGSIKKKRGLRPGNSTITK